MAPLRLLRGGVLLSTLFLVLTNFGKASSSDSVVRNNVAKFHNYEESVDSGTDVLIRSRREAILRRQKRIWKPLPFTLKENDVGPFPKFLQTINSDEQQTLKVKYILHGEGVDTYPIGLFIINSTTGGISVTRAVDREQFSVFKLTGRVETLEGFSREEPLEITVKVIDVNDNKPMFKKPEMVTYVPELSAPGTHVANLTATDKDQKNTQATLLKYRIRGPESNLFAVDPSTGVITTKTPIPPQSTQDTYILEVEVRDSGGKSFGLFSTGRVTVHVTDVNNHLPTFVNSKYTVSVKENKNNVELLKIPVTDKDEPNTNASRAVFTITKGNENEQFKIVTDSKTNQGILSVVKPLDAEAAKVMVLTVKVANEVPLIGDPAPLNSAEVTVNVENVDEGPEFVPAVKRLSIKEDMPIGSDIGSYTARDAETQRSDGMMYKILDDPAKWVFIDENTGKITNIALMDRESSFVKNNKYNVTVLAIDRGTPSQTGTGTVIINLNDVNDHMPSIEEGDRHICQNGNQNYVKISPVDRDTFPHSAPFRFLFPDTDIKEKWEFAKINATYVFLAPKKNLPNGYYEVPVIIQDQQNHGRKNIVKVLICDCPDGLHCENRFRRRSTILGGWGILAMLVGALLLLCLFLAALVCYFKRANEAKINYIANNKYHESLIVTNEEGGGQQDKDMGLSPTPFSNEMGQLPGREFLPRQQTVRYTQTDGIKDETLPFNNGGMMDFYLSGYEEGMTEHHAGSMRSQESMMNTRMHYSGTLNSQRGLGGSRSIRQFNGSSRKGSVAIIEMLRSHIDQVYEEEEPEANYLKHELELDEFLDPFSDAKITPMI